MDKCTDDQVKMFRNISKINKLETDKKAQQNSRKRQQENNYEEYRKNLI